jgi:hypothetical protein
MTTPAQARELLDDDGENRAVRTFLQLYGGASSPTIGQMRGRLEASGFDKFWPDWVCSEFPSTHLTKGGAQDWLRHLFGLEQSSARDGWLPIESAPEVKGKFFFCRLAWGPDGDKSTSDGFRWNGRWFAAGIFYAIGQDRRYGLREIEVKPSHYMELHAPPIAAAQEEDQ